MMCWKCHARLSFAAAVICTALCEALLTLRQTLILLHWKNAVDIVFRHCCLSLRSRANTLIANKYCLLFLAWPLEAVFLMATFWLLYLPTAWTATCLPACLPLCLPGTFFSQWSSPNELTKLISHNSTTAQVSAPPLCFNKQCHVIAAFEVSLGS